MKFIRHEDIYLINDFCNFDGEEDELYIPNSPWEILKRLDKLLASLHPLTDNWINSFSIVAPKDVFKFAGKSSTYLGEHYSNFDFDNDLFIKPNHIYTKNIPFTFEIGYVVPPIFMFSILFQMQFRLAIVGHNLSESELIFYDSSSGAFIPITIFSYYNESAEKVPQFMQQFVATFDNISKIQMDYDLTRSHFER